MLTELVLTGVNETLNINSVVLIESIIDGYDINIQWYIINEIYERDFPNITSILSWLVHQSSYKGNTNLICRVD